jgi:chromosome segregation ATPase
MSRPDSTIKIKKTTIERGVRVTHGGSEDESSHTKLLAAATIQKKRTQEKQELVRLNERFAIYIERVKFLEGQNKRLSAELSDLRQKWGDESRLIKECFGPELQLAREEIDSTTKDKAHADIRAKRGEFDAFNYKRQYEAAADLLNADKQKMQNLEYLLQENRNELESLHRQTSQIETDISKYKTEVERLTNDINVLADELDQETLRRACLENEKQTLEEKMLFLNSVHEQEVAELRALQAGAHVDPVQFYRYELERAVRDIRSDFAFLNESQKRELEEYYKIKTEELEQQVLKRDQLDSSSQLKSDSVQSIRQSYSDSHKDFVDLKNLNAKLVQRLGQLEEELDNARHRNATGIEERDRELNEIKFKVQEMLNDNDQLLSNKTSLEFEINTYKRLLESEEHYSTRFAYDTAKQASSMGAPVPPNRFKTLLKTDQAPTPPPAQPQTASQVSVSKLASRFSNPIDNRLSATEMTSKTTFQRSAKGMF